MKFPLPDMDRSKTGLRVIQAVLALVLLLACHHLMKGTKPWDRKVAEHITKAAPKGTEPAQLTSFSGWLKSDVTHKDVLGAKDHGIIGRYYAAAGIAGLSLLLLVTAPRWVPGSRGRTASFLAQPDGTRRGPAPVLIYGLIGVAVLAGGWFRLSPLGHSLWNDEEYALRRYVHGGYETHAGGQPVFEAADWTDTLVENNNANNHLLFSVLARGSLSLWHSLTGQPPEAFSEVALRMPSYLAGLATLLLVGMLGVEAGAPWAGVGASWLLALHPWHVRYAAEARGYSLMLCFICLSLLGLLMLLREDSLKGWLLFALGEAGYLCSFAGALYVAMALNALVVLHFLVRREPRRVVPLLGFNALAAIPVLLLMLPSIPQLLGFMEYDDGARQKSVMGMGWVQDLGSHLALGILHANPMPEAHAGTSWEMLTAASPLLMKVFALVMGLLTALGLVVAGFHSKGLRLVVAGVSLGGVLACLHATATEHVNLSWYFLYLLIPVVFSAPLVVGGLRRFAGPAIGLLVAFYAVVSATPRRVFMEHDRQPIRQAVEAVRGASSNAITATFGVSDRQIQSYDPQVRLLGSVAELEELISRAGREQRPLMIYLCGPRETSQRRPELSSRVMEKNDFRKVMEVKATEEMFSYTIYQWHRA